MNMRMSMRTWYATPLRERFQLVDGAFLKRDARRQLEALLQPLGGREDLLPLEHGRA